MIILDTHVLIWWVSDPQKLSEKARKKIKDGLKKSEILVSSISVWEICMLVKKGRLKLTMDVDNWLEKVENLPYIHFVPIDNKIASKSVDLPDGFHQDPADRMIVATALQKGAILITSDKKILRYPHVRSLW